MPRYTSRARWVIASASLLVAPLMGGCDVKDELLQPQNPGIIDPAATNSPAAAVGLRTGALGQLKNRTAGGESVWLFGGLLADEWKSSDTFTQRNETDQRAIQTSNANVAGAYNNLQQTRGFTRTAIDKSLVYTPDSKGDIAEMYFTLGFEELSLAENFCNGIPLSYTVDGIPIYGKPFTNDSIFKIAITHFDSALTLSSGSDAKSLSVHQAASLGKARTLVDLGQFATAAPLVTAASVPTAYQYLLTFDQTTGDNGIWTQNNSNGRYTVSDSVDNITGIIPNALPFFSAKDPRVPTASPSSPKPFDAVTPLRTQQIWAGRSDPVPLVSGLDARLIEAETHLQTADYAGMMTILNALRTTSQTIGPLKVPVMPALATTPTTKDAAVSLFFREKAFWVFGRGQRLSDLRRMIRQYGRTQDQVFPMGAFHKGGNFGTDVNLPVPDAELTNPNFKGCLDRKA
jgi:starch-binding outer membrane protein, SusD/RagB family